jgi:hypothetical protein
VLRIAEARGKADGMGQHLMDFPPPRYRVFSGRVCSRGVRQLRISRPYPLFLQETLHFTPAQAGLVSGMFRTGALSGVLIARSFCVRVDITAPSDADTGVSEAFAIMSADEG